MTTVNYWLSFKVATDRSTSKGDDAKRRQSIYDTVTLMDVGHWKETTSFILFEAPDTIDAVGRKIVAGLDADLDTVVIRRVSNSAARYWGVVTDPASLGGYVAGIARLC
ncbi:hypothetical protein [Agrobacterium cavarae]|uniref:hypothetical protein n=1 Tax=Agrobacterium cavarae TaxID=2528239 RepID=UPI00289C0162|nr:hypothetical protein [Agrobacterium cavarae]